MNKRGLAKRAGVSVRALIAQAGDLRTAPDLPPDQLARFVDRFVDAMRRVVNQLRVDPPGLDLADPLTPSRTPPSRP